MLGDILFIVKGKRGIVKQHFQLPDSIAATGIEKIKQVDLLKGKKSDRVEVSLQPKELEVMDNVLPSKYEEAREEEKLRSQREDFSDMVAENEKKRKRKIQEKEGKSKKKDFKLRGQDFVPGVRRRRSWRLNVLGMLAKI
ncbi:hypothetical protein CRYUN_Cryun32bG0036000 [Craigia yunnanensis]